MKILNRRYLFLILIFIMLSFFYFFQFDNSLTIQSSLKADYNVKILLYTKNSTITYFSETKNKFLDVHIEKIPKGDYNLMVLLYSDDSIVAHTLPIPIKLSYFTRIKVNYLKFDYIDEEK